MAEVPGVALRVCVADPRAVVPSALSIADGSADAATIRFWFFVGSPRRIVLPVTLDATSLARVRAHQRKIIMMVVLTWLMPVAVLWQLVSAVTDLVSGERTRTGSGLIALIPVLVLLFGIRTLERTR